MKRFVKAAEATSAEDAIKEKLSSLKDDFNYASEGIDKLVADGDLESAKTLADELDTSINEIINEIATAISE